MKRERLLTLIGSICLILVLAALLLPACAKEAPAPAPAPTPPTKHEITISIYQSSTHDCTVWHREHAPFLEEMSGGRLIPKIYDSATIAKGKEQFDAVQKNLADLSFAYGGFISSTFPVLDITGTVPAVLRSNYEWWKAWPKLTGIIQKAMEDAGYDNIVLCDVPYYGGWYKIATTKQLKVPGDLKGLKVKVSGKGLVAYVESLGGSPVVMATAEVYEAASRGMIDGAVGVHTHWTGWKQMEVFDYLLDLPISPSTMHWVVNKSTLEKLGPELADILMDWCRLDMALMSVNSIVMEARSEAIASEYMELYRPTAAEAELWYAPAEDAVKDWVERASPYGAEIVKLVEAMRESKAKTFRDW